MKNELEKFLLENSPFQNYLYSYPHKTAYREFSEAKSVQSIWADENRDSLYLYLHIPFCRSKCSFCNLFSLAGSDSFLVEKYLNTLALEAEAVRDNLGSFSFSGWAIGGGTPSILSTAQLERLFSICTDTLNINLSEIPGSFEISPDTITPEKLHFLSERKIERISIGIQSFDEAEAGVMGRVQKKNELNRVLETISSLAFPQFNIDLIYGIPGQSEKSWLASLEQALIYNPSELFLYPLYVRPLTALFEKRSADTHDIRSDLYRIGRDFLRSRGYVQDSMRLFRRNDTLPKSTEYSCQEDGMIGLGTNARSYTKTIHYSTPYAVSRRKTAEIVSEYSGQSRSDFDTVRFGIELSESERKRRYLIKSILKAEGLSVSHYENYFNSALQNDFPELAALNELGCTTVADGIIRLTDEGTALSDLIGNWFISDQIRQKMKEYVHG